jgi:hypothetical protein
MRVPRTFASAAALAVLAGTVSLSTSFAPGALAGTQPGSQLRTTGLATGMSGGCPVNTKRGLTGNCVEMIDPADSTYVPNIRAASDRAITKAQRLLNGANRFCNNHTVAGLKAKSWRPGHSHPSNPTHFFNPDHNSAGVLHPANPRAALVYDGKLGGVMFTGVPLPHLGSIPRAHTHASMEMGSEKGVEMVHVYCTSSLKKAFTPNRLLGVKAMMITLRLQIRPAVMDLNKWQLRAVRHKVRGYCGDRLQHVAPVAGDGTGPDPVLQAMRTEIRNSLMLLTETQLRRVRHLMRSY